MTIELKPDQQRTIEQAVRSGVYRNQDEVLEQVFEIIRSQLDHEDWLSEQRETLFLQIDSGFAQAQRGELVDGAEAITSLKQRRAERAKSPG